MVKSILPLKINGAVVNKRRTRIIGPIDLSVGTIGTLIVIGPNGSGKTTLLRLMHGLERPHLGNLQWNTGAADVYKRQSFVFQTPIMMHRSVEENVAYPLLIRGDNKASAMKQAIEAIDKAGLSRFIGRRATSLSGGEKQKLAISRALITKPEILFLDEPTTNLDGGSVKDIEAILRHTSKTGTRIVMATHDLFQARRLASEIVFMYRGEIHEAVAAEQFFKDAKTQEAAAFLKGDIVV